MRNLFVLAVSIVIGETTFAVAEPCVGADFEKPFPGGRDVVTRRADVRSSLFPGVWQEGSVADLSYKLYGNGDAVVQAKPLQATWRLSYSCPQDGSLCGQDVQGAPPPEAFDLLDDLNTCYRNEKPAAPTASIDPIKVTEQNEADQVQASPCGSATFSDEQDEVVLQKLLTLAGTDPGVADGIIGPKTTRALVDALGEIGPDLEVTKAIEMLDGILCE